MLLYYKQLINFDCQFMLKRLLSVNRLHQSLLSLFFFIYLLLVISKSRERKSSEYWLCKWRRSRRTVVLKSREVEEKVSSWECLTFYKISLFVCGVDTNIGKKWKSNGKNSMWKNKFNQNFQSIKNVSMKLLTFRCVSKSEICIEVNREEKKVIDTSIRHFAHMCIYMLD